MIQRAHIRALEVGTGFADALAVVGRVRARHAEIPIGLLVYGSPADDSLTESYGETHPVARASRRSTSCSPPVGQSASFREGAGTDCAFP